MEVLTVATIGLGGLFMINNNKHKNKTQEPFTSHVDTYPIKSSNILPTDDDYIKRYNGEQTTDKIYNNILAHSELIDTTNIDSLAGNKIAKDDFVHNNMVPFFGGKLTGINPDQNSQIILDNYSGEGSQINKKKEVAPLFKPEENIQWAHGMPNNSDFMQSHQYVSGINNNTKPWEEQLVGPGLNQGFGQAGSGGFNSGMEARCNWGPKTVDELRTDNNPKTVGILSGLEGPAESKIFNRGIEGKIEKNRPDTDFVWGHDRLFTTTGIHTAQTTRSKQELGYVNRPETTKEHFGVMGNSDYQAQSAKKSYNELAKRPHCYGESIGNPYASSKYNSTKNDYGIDSYKINANNRVTTDSATEFGIVGSAIGSLIAPILDILKPSRKENVLGNLRESGNVQNQMATYTMNPGDKPKTTIKEMTVGSKNHYNVQAQRDGNGSYTVSKHYVGPNQRDTTNCSIYGNPGQDREGSYLVSEQDPINNQRMSSTREIYGNAASHIKGPNQIDKYLRQRNSHNKQQKAFTPAGNGDLFSGSINAEIVTMRDDKNTRNNQPTVTISHTPHQALLGESSHKVKAIEPPNDYLNPDLLDAFKQNPFTKSLNSY